jgi:glycosyltransferase involved in cell wall biosynthesis
MYAFLACARLNEVRGVGQSGLWIVIPAYNEGTVIARVVCEARSATSNVVVVDDGSSDDTAEQAYQAKATVVSHPFNLGQGAAIRTGIEYAIEQDATHIATFDADGQHRIEDLKRLYHSLSTHDADIALGSRFLGNTPNISLRRKIVLKLGILFTWMTSGIRLTDTHNGLRVMTAGAARKMRITNNGMAHASEIIELIKEHKLRVIEEPVTILYTEYSLSKGQPLSNAFNIVLELLSRKLSR